MQFKGTKNLKILHCNEIGIGIGGNLEDVKITVWGNNQESKYNALLITNSELMLMALKTTLEELRDLNLLDNHCNYIEKLIKELI